MLAVYAGYSLNREHVDAGAALQPFVQDALDEIEYATGAAGTKWGAERVKDGHPAALPAHPMSRSAMRTHSTRSGSYVRTVPLHDMRPRIQPEMHRDRGGARGAGSHPARAGRL